VCEEHEILRAGLLALLAEDRVLAVTAMLPEQITEHVVDVAIVSSKAACGARFQCPIVIVSDENEAPTNAVVGNDVAGVLRRDSLTVSQLLASVHAAAVGLRLQAQFGNGSDAALDPRAVRVLELIADGCSTREIATSMNYSERTIKKLINELEDRLQARTRAQTVAHAMRRGLI
jgi:DNA-binding NarL/FixJ family response regulator